MEKFVSYVRVSTQQQGHSGLGLEAQQNMIKDFIKNRGVLDKEFIEIASGTKKLDKRPQLKEAIEYCRKNGCTLVFGKIDRLARNVGFFLDVIDNSKVKISFADMPDMDVQSDDGRMLLINLANFAEYEARRISRRTKEALAVTKAKGKKLGVMGSTNIKNVNDTRIIGARQFAQQMKPTIIGLRFDENGKKRSLRKIANCLNVSRSKTITGKKWTAVQVTHVLNRLNEYPNI